MTDRACDLCDTQADIWLAGGLKLCDEHYDQARAWRKAVEDQALAEMGGPIPQRCPRRDEVFQQGGPADETPDEWRFGHGLVTDELWLTCNYCGSLHPDVFMQKVREGWVVGPTDKNYKCYLRRAGGAEGSSEAKFYFQHLSTAQREEFVDLLNAGRMNVGYPGSFYRLPFFVRST